jgi:hypothetical protein
MALCETIRTLLLIRCACFSVAYPCIDFKEAAAVAYLHHANKGSYESHRKD